MEMPRPTLGHKRMESLAGKTAQGQRPENQSATCVQQQRMHARATYDVTDPHQLVPNPPPRLPAR